MPVVHNGKALNLGGGAPIPRSGIDKLKLGKSKCYSARTGSSKMSFIAFNKGILRVESDLAVVREHFAVNVSNALKVSLHLTAQAIRAGRMNVGGTHETNR